MSFFYVAVAFALQFLTVDTFVIQRQGFHGHCSRRTNAYLLEHGLTRHLRAATDGTNDIRVDSKDGWPTNTVEGTLNMAGTEMVQSAAAEVADGALDTSEEFFTLADLPLVAGPLAAFVAGRQALVEREKIRLEVNQRQTELLKAKNESSNLNLVTSVSSNPCNDWQKSKRFCLAVS